MIIDTSAIVALIHDERPHAAHVAAALAGASDRSCRRPPSLNASSS